MGTVEPPEQPDDLDEVVHESLLSMQPEFERRVSEALFGDLDHSATPQGLLSVINSPHSGDLEETQQ